MRHRLLTWSVLVVLLGASALGAEITGGQSLGEALEELRSHGLRLVYSTALVSDELTVCEPPPTGSPRFLLDEILRPHGLAVREGPGGRLVVVRSEDAGTWAVIRGTLTEAAGLPFTGLWVEVSAAEMRAPVDDDGRFEVTGLAPGSYRLEVWLEGLLVGRVDEIIVRPGEIREVVVPTAGVQAVDGSGEER